MKWHSENWQYCRIDILQRFQTILFLNALIDPVKLSAHTIVHINYTELLFCFRLLSSW